MQVRLQITIPNDTGGLVTAATFQKDVEASLIVEKLPPQLRQIHLSRVSPSGEALSPCSPLPLAESLEVQYLMLSLEVLPSVHLHTEPACCALPISIQRMSCSRNFAVRCGSARVQHCFERQHLSGRTDMGRGDSSSSDVKCAAAVSCTDECESR